MPLSITGGYLKGRAVNFSAGKARPTSAKLRQALFNILGPIEGLTFCDLFAGTGIVGFEAISRGVSSVSFVESDPISARAIKTSLNLLAIPNRCVSIFTVKTQKWLSADNQKYDLIFADPPFIEKGDLRIPRAKRACSRTPLGWRNTNRPASVQNANPRSLGRSAQVRRRLASLHSKVTSPSNKPSGVGPHCEASAERVGRVYDSFIYCIFISADSLRACSRRRRNIAMKKNHLCA